MNAQIDPSEMCEFFIWQSGAREQRALALELWIAIARNDNEFHYIHEPAYLLFRVHRSMADKYRGYLVVKGYDHEYHDEWREDSEAVKDNWNFFAAYFHILSVMALSDEPLDPNNDEDLYKFERVIHIFYNLMFPYHWTREGFVLSRMATERTFFDGRLYGALMAKKDNNTGV